MLLLTWGALKNQFIQLINQRFNLSIISNPRRFSCLLEGFRPIRNAFINDVLIIITVFAMFLNRLGNYSHLSIVQRFIGR